jgi:hypothetical protein
VLVVNHLVYGSATTTGYHLVNRVLRETLNPPGGSFLSFNPHAAAKHLYFYVIQLPLILGVPLLGVIFGARKLLRKPRLRAPVIAILISSVLTIAYHAGLGTFGSTIAAVNASFVRYILPMIAVWVVFLAYGIATESDRPTGSARLFFVALTIVSVITGIVGPLGVVNRLRTTSQHKELRAEVVARTEPGALIASRLADRDLFPERQTLTMTYLLENRDTSSAKRNVSQWDNLPTPDRFASIAARIRALGLPLDLLCDFRDPKLAAYEAALHRNGMRLSRRSYFRRPLPQLYAIVSGA